MVLRTEDGSLHHVEFQSSNEAAFAVRMLEYYAYLLRVHKQHIVQTVLYLGREPLRLERTLKSPSMDFRFEIINLREYDAEPLLASPDWADNALALLAGGDSRKALDVALSRLRAMNSEDQAWASGTLLLLSGILGIEETVDARLKEVGMINVMENKVLGPLILKRCEEAEQVGRSQGIQQGMQQGRLDLLREQLTEKFGSLPPWAIQRLEAASADDLHTWAKRVLHGTTLEDTIR